MNRGLSRGARTFACCVAILGDITCAVCPPFPPARSINDISRRSDRLQVFLTDPLVSGHSESPMVCGSPAGFTPQVRHNVKGNPGCHENGS